MSQITIASSDINPHLETSYFTRKPNWNTVLSSFSLIYTLKVYLATKYGLIGLVYLFECFKVIVSVPGTCNAENIFTNFFDD